MTTVAAKPAAPGSWWLVMLGGMAGHAARVAEADRARAALLATVSHDLRAPLAAAKAAVSGLRAGDARLTTDDCADLLAAAEESLDRLAHLAASLLDVSRLQAGAQAVFPRAAHVGEIVAAALEALDPQPKPVLADIPSGLPEVMADPAIAERVIVKPGTGPVCMMESVPSFAGPAPGFRSSAGVSGSPVTSGSDTSVPACAQPGERHARKELLITAPAARYQDAASRATGSSPRRGTGGRGIAYFILGDDGSALRQSSMITAPAAAKAAQDVR